MEDQSNNIVDGGGEGEGVRREPTLIWLVAEKVHELL